MNKAKPSTFGMFFRSRRQALGLSLRDFCKKHHLDPGNVSKLERGQLSPPQSKDKLESYARALALVPGSPEWEDFFDLACAQVGRIPEELMDDRVIESLPLLFKSLRGDEQSSKRIASLLRQWRQS